MDDGSSGISLILLAAGGGSRFGGDPGDKLFADYGGLPLIQATLSGMIEAPVDEIVIVAGARAGEVREACELYRARDLKVVENPEWRAGMSTSVRLGISSCASGAQAAVATYGDEQRNPALFARGLWPMLAENLSGDAGARSVLRERQDLVTEVPCDGVADPADVDTGEDLWRLESMMYPATGRER
ncbi:nucleotidyltransferase family protein [Rubrobacter aplysinae]|uniref:nucleotidyltransferase family protein n=1 Tax=Rubrobacter aplysinae TaxID=909625 RepID=UPI00064C3FC5|nr:nucleotidyltransferase family protein [Rubrobacter aplysinae]